MRIMGPGLLVFQDSVGYVSCVSCNARHNNGGLLHLYRTKRLLVNVSINTCVYLSTCSYAGRWQLIITASQSTWLNWMNVNLQLPVYPNILSLLVENSFKAALSTVTSIKPFYLRLVCQQVNNKRPDPVN